MPTITEYQHAGKTYKFSPLPANKTTASFFLAMSRLSKDPLAPFEIIGVLPDCLERSMKAHHTEEEMNGFIETIVLDFSKPSELAVLWDLNALFLGLNPKKPQEPTSGSAES